MSATLHPVMFRALWNFRGFVFGAVHREFQARYRGSLFGSFWAVLNPLAMILVFTLIFTQVMGAKLPGNAGGVFGYSVYLCAGLLPWNFFAELIGRLNTVFIENGNLIKKSSFPRACLPMIALLSTLINFTIVFALYMIFLGLIGHLPGTALLAFPIVLSIQIAFALGLGVLLGTLNVFFRDVGQFTGVLLQFWLWFTPIVYVTGVLPERLRAIIRFNPMLPVIEAYHAIFSQSTIPDWISLAYPALLALFLLCFGGLMFLRHAGEIVDEL